MSRSPDSGQLDLSEVFLRVQQEMLAQMAVGGLFENSSAAGAATERNWIDLFNRYLPQRYRSTSAFVIDSTGRRSRQIDIAIFDNLYSPLLFPHPSGLHIAAESVYAVFEVKPTISRQWIRDAGEKAASVRALLRTSVPVMAGGAVHPAIRPSPILAGLLGTDSVWSAETFGENVRGALDALSTSVSCDEHLDLGCSLRHGAFEQHRPSVRRAREEARRFSEAHSPGSASSHEPQPKGAVKKRAREEARRFSAPPCPWSASATGRPSGNRTRISEPPCPWSASVIGRPSGSSGANKRNRKGSGQTAGPQCVSVSTPDESLIFFILRLLERLREVGTAPAADLMEYGRSLRSFKH